MSNIKPWKRLASKTVFQHPRMTLVEDDVALPNGKIIQYLRHDYQGNGSVTVVCASEGKVLLQKEFSYPTGEVLYQFPGGKIEREETPLEAAQRELAEESGLTSDNMKYLGWYYVDNRRTNARMHVIFAGSAREDNGHVPDEEEFIVSEWIEIDKFQNMICQGKIVNFSVLAAWALVTSKVDPRSFLL